MDQPPLRRNLGKTGGWVSAIGLGGFHLGEAGEAESIRIVRTAIDNGITFLDNSWDYHGGASEERMGRALADGYRERAFLMTKIDGRTWESANAQLEESLVRLRTDRVDLLQFHEIIRMEDADQIFAPGGALEAVVAAREAGKVRFIGFTGHKHPAVHRHMLEVADAHDFSFDTVQLPLNAMDAHVASFEKLVLPVLVTREVGVLDRRLVEETSKLRIDTASLRSDLRQEMATLGSELRQEMATLGSELRQEMATLGSDLRQEMATLGSELRQEMATLGSDLRQEMTQGFAAVRQEMATLGSDLRQETGKQHHDLVKWAFLFWVGQVGALAAVLAFMQRG